ncbi:hypothetical protein PIB30_029488 [Stylosanthes scabra]|uniref:Uncharacterized protein n=1 Tax=Stylosanthes scabra TaxID=79078 RepID=A0ABU6RBM3_9FABA|nr:hypothetical protein [Stylosanthes scabra]
MSTQGKQIRTRFLCAKRRTRWWGLSRAVTSTHPSLMRKQLASDSLSLLSDKACRDFVIPSSECTEGKARLHHVRWLYSQGTPVKHSNGSDECISTVGFAVHPSIKTSRHLFAFSSEHEFRGQNEREQGWAGEWEVQGRILGKHVILASGAFVQQIATIHRRLISVGLPHNIQPVAAIGSLVWPGPTSGADSPSGVSLASVGPVLPISRGACCLSGRMLHTPPLLRHPLPLDGAHRLHINISCVDLANVAMLSDNVLPAAVTKQGQPT